MERECPLLIRLYKDYRKHFKGGDKLDILNEISIDVCEKKKCPLNHCIEDYIVDEEDEIMAHDESRLVTFYAQMKEEEGELWWRM